MSWNQCNSPRLHPTTVILYRLFNVLIAVFNVFRLLRILGKVWFFCFSGVILLLGVWKSSSSRRVHILYPSGRSRIRCLCLIVSPLMMVLYWDLYPLGLWEFSVVLIRVVFQRRGNGFQLRSFNWGGVFIIFLVSASGYFPFFYFLLDVISVRLIMFVPWKYSAQFVFLMD